MVYIVKKTDMYGGRIYGPYGNYQEALEASHELEKSCCSECFFAVECIGRAELKSYNQYPTDRSTRTEGFDIT